MSTGSVRSELAKLGLERFAAKFIDDGYDDVSDWAQLSSSELADLGIVKGHLRKWRKRYSEKTRTRGKSSGVSRIPITVLGGGAVGKSSLTLQMICNEFPDYYDPTIEDKYTVQKLFDGRVSMFDVLDTAGQEEYLALVDDWIRASKGYILVYSVTDTNSWQELMQFYSRIDRINELAKDMKDIPLVVVGNKCDLKMSRRVDRKMVERQCQEWGCAFFEASAKENINVEEAFFECGRRIRKLYEPKAMDPDPRRSWCAIL